MIKRIRTRIDGSSEQAFTSIELLVVIIIVGILVTIAVPAYLGFRDRTANNEAMASLRAALPAAEAYRSDEAPAGGAGTYTGMTAEKLIAIDPGLSPTLTVVSASARTYCLTDSVSGRAWSVEGPRPSSADFRPNDACA
jgi:prepilin-type N-terminal cleavage/methylation domain-containing protein